MPAASPGARIQDGTGASSGTTFCVSRRCSAAYIIRTGLIASSGNSLVWEDMDTASNPMAVSRPSRSAPSRTCCEVAGRCPVRANICCRETA